MQRYKPLSYRVGFPIVILLLLALLPLSCVVPGGESAFDSEGSSEAPIVIDPNTSHSGTVGTDRSYYKTYGVSDYNVMVYLRDLSDDADIIDFKTDSTFSNQPLPDTDDYFQRSRVRSGDYPFFGRTMEEYITEVGPVSVLYFVVDGSYSSSGAAYTLRVSSTGPASVSAYSHGSAAEPELFPLGVLTSTSVGTVDPSYYKVPATAGKSYLANASGVDVTLYLEPGFSSPQAGPSQNVGPVTATDDYVYLKAEGSGVFFDMEVVSSEGSLSVPVDLFEEKSHWCQIGSNSSYYRFGVSSGKSYTVKLIPNPGSYNVSFEAFNSGNFSNSVGTADDKYPDPETLSFTTGGEQITVRVDDTDGNGATFILRAYQN
jgi:hypothetical protein